MTENLAAALRLLLVTDDRLLGDRDPLALVQAAVRGGVTAVQLRFKHRSDRELLALARGMVASLPVPVFINDRVDIALAARAQGCHLGNEDLPPSLAREIVPPGFWIGASVGDAAERVRGASADYWGIGPLHGSTTKSDAGAALGWSGAVELLGAHHPPAIVIGGVRPEDVGQALHAGFVGVAVSSGILAEDDPESAARRYCPA